MDAYAEALRKALYASLCLSAFPSQLVERQSQPEIEVATSPELLLPPLTVSRKSGESCLIEPSINACRVSFCFRAGDALDGLLAASFHTFMRQHAEHLPIVRRHPVAGHDVSFLVTDAHTARYKVCDLIDFFVAFASETPGFLRELKLAVSAQNRAAAADFVRSFSSTARRDVSEV